MSLDSQRAQPAKRKRSSVNLDKTNAQKTKVARVEQGGGDEKESGPPHQVIDRCGRGRLMCLTSISNGEFAAGIRIKDTGVQFYNAESGAKLHSPFDMGTMVDCMTISPDGLLAIGHGALGNGCVSIFDINSGTAKRVKDLPIPYPMSVAFSPDGLLAAAGLGRNQTVCVWNAKEAFVPHGKPFAFNAHAGSVVFSPTGKMAITLSLQDEEVPPGEENFQEISNPAVTVAIIDPKSRSVQHARIDLEIGLPCVAVYEEKKTPVVLVSCLNGVFARATPDNALYFHPKAVVNAFACVDPQRFLTGDSEGRVLFWDTTTQDEKSEHFSGVPQELFSGSDFNPKKREVGKICITADKKRAIVGLKNGTVYICPLPKSCGGIRHE